MSDGEARRWRTPTIPIILGAAALVLVARFLMPLWPAPVTRSRGTSFLLGPVRPDGTIDYPAALDAALGEGVTAENNAVIPMLRAVGPKLLIGSDSDNVLAALGVVPASEDAGRFLEFSEYLAVHMADEELGVRPQTAESRRAAAVSDRYMKLMLSGKGVDGSPESEYGRALAALIPTKAELARKRAWEVFEQAGGSSWKADEHPLLAKWLESSAGALALAEEASRRERWYVPITTGQLVKRCVVSVGTFGDIGHAFAFRAMRSLGAGDAGAAFEDAQTLHRLARLPIQEKLVISHMAGLNIEIEACRVDVAVAAKGRLSAPQARGMLARLRSLPPWPDCKEAIDLGERCTALDILVSTVRRGGGPSRANVDLDLMLRRVNECFDRVVASYDEPTVAARCAAFSAASAAEVQEIEEYTRRYSGAAGKLRMIAASSWGRRRITSTVIANVTLAIALPNLEPTERANAEGRMRLELAEVAFALAAHRAERGELPAALEELVPARLSALPQDVFAGGPFRYRREGAGCLLYSIGGDMKDDGGDAKKDLVVRFE